MSWSDVKLADVQPESGYAELTPGEFTFALLPGAATRINNFGTEELVARAACLDVPNQGRQVFLQYPDPSSVNTKTGKKATWSAQALKKLEIALGTDQEDGETPVEYLNRVAGNGHSNFKMSLVENAKEKDGVVIKKVAPALFSVAPAA